MGMTSNFFPGAVKTPTIMQQCVLKWDGTMDYRSDVLNSNAKLISIKCFTEPLFDTVG